eukprot:TRINITY_DN2613_c0_g1_i1.p1 TRINITY_DN2613_c0_g1~~TRINITY_DN2613_c0_g1_i1.p1  ORF type:complete len:637 (+),score=177.23 TRINITY_DN2613_c0_g1_i1:53-1963(+)
MEPHPLDLLSPDEIRTAITIVKKKFPPHIRFVIVELKEPIRREVLNFKFSPDRAVKRDIRMILLDKKKPQSYEVEVSLNKNEITKIKPLDNIQPALMGSEYAQVEKMLKENKQFQESLKKRGIKNMDLVNIDVWSVGWYSDEDNPNRRLCRPFVFYKVHPDANGYACPVEGLSPLIDLNTLEVIKIDDFSTVPLPPYTGEYKDTWKQMQPVSPLKPLKVVQPQGPSFKITGNLVNWYNWEFRVGFNPREGVVLYNIGWYDKGRLRPIFHRLSLAEMIVPYAAPFPPHFRKNAFDVGEEGVGYNSNTLKSGCDCAGVPAFFDAHMTTSDGDVLTIPDAVCLHEEDDGILWKHTDWRTGKSEVRRARRLVTSFFATVANYDYGFYWQMYLDGTIQYEVRLTGILSTKVTGPGETDTKYGTPVAPQISATIHQHFFCVRMDPCIDGPTNSIYEINTALAEPDKKTNPYGNAYSAVYTQLKNETEAQRIINPLTGRCWNIVNPSVYNRFGNKVAYKIEPLDNVMIYSQPDSFLLNRAPYLKNHLYATVYHQNQRFPAGDYPNQAAREENGITTWQKANRSLDNTDLVVWYNFGVHHIPRPEDWPIMPSIKAGFILRANGFFDENPALCVPPTPCQIQSKL